LTTVAFITNQPLTWSDNRPVSELASVRREVVLPAIALDKLGIEAIVISLPHYARQHVRELVVRAHQVVLGKIFQNPKRDLGQPFSWDAHAYRNVLADLVDGQGVALCMSDDHLDEPGFSEFYREAAARSPRWFVSSALIRDRLSAFVKQPVLVYPEPVETIRASACVPRRGLRVRIGAAIARRLKVGLEPWRVRLLWFGHPTNVESLLAALPELEQFALDVPLHLECVTQPGTRLMARLTPRSAEFSSPLRISFTPWSLEATQQALMRCDAVLLPQLVEDRAKRAKSNNRMIDSLHCGRFVVAHPLPAYEDLREHAWVGDSLSEGLRWLLDHPEEALQRVQRGQAYVSKHHSIERLGEFWLDALGLEKRDATVQ
jgi:glycosyltransferase involved in cell wall biosynthesis